MESKTTFVYTSNPYFWKNSFIVSPAIVEFFVKDNILCVFLKDNKKFNKLLG